MSDFIFGLLGVRIHVTDTEKILGILEIDDKNLLNLVNVIVKQYIYTCRCNNILPTHLLAISKIKDVRNIEYAIAIKK